jgi:hypothetical protein
MKHEAFFKTVLAALHEPWMNEEDKKAFDDELIAQYGAQVDKDIEVGIANGYPVEQQMALCLKVLRQEGS